MNCRCGGTLYRCTKCGATWCYRRYSKAGNANPPSNAINKCPRCDGARQHDVRKVAVEEPVMDLVEQIADFLRAFWGN